MGSLTQTIIDGYIYLFDELVHPITKNWFLVGNPVKLVCLLITYLLICTKLGPWYMKDKKPYNLKNVIKYYNLIQVIVNLYIFYEGIVYIFSREFSFQCQNLDDPQSPRAYRVASMAWVYYTTKLSDLLDTVFFVLRKSNRQITSLHLHHHTLMPIGSWIAVTYFPGGQAVLAGCMNGFVHAVMYGYYFIAGLGDEYKKYLWWKRHVTELQLIQFVIGGTHAINTLFHECGYPTWIKVLTSIYAVIFMNMFGKFYYHAYVSKGNKITDKEVKSDKSANPDSFINHMNEKEAKTMNITYRNAKTRNVEESKMR